ncbi:MAG: NifU family protein [Candidatus Puniceispirillum sp.]|nr:NifU family protein [Candidatus Pelagibacter sp.]MBA4283706.1 NifU family protein [Candidatus Puniceispirillum sp.]
MFIETKETPNPSSIMFYPGIEVMNSQEPLYFTKTDVCKESAFARILLEINGVDCVFLGKDFITVTKNDDYDWYALKPHILGHIMEAIINKVPFYSVNEPKVEVERSDIDNSIIAQIKEVIEEKVRPAVAQDGGDIVFHSFEEGIVYLKMLGACSGCPSSSITLKSGIENMLRYYVPEVVEVRQI